MPNPHVDHSLLSVNLPWPQVNATGAELQGRVSLENCTFTANVVPFAGGVVYAGPGTALTAAQLMFASSKEADGAACQNALALLHEQVT